MGHSPVRRRARWWTGDRHPSAVQVLFAALLVAAFGLLVIGVIATGG